MSVTLIAKSDFVENQKGLDPAVTTHNLYAINLLGTLWYLNRIDRKSTSVLF